MRFDVGGAETLSSVDFYIYGPGSSDPAGTQDLYVNVYDDDGSGLPGALIATQTIPAFSYPFFPSVISVSFAPLVLENTFHVAIGTNGVWDGLVGVGPGDANEAILSSDGTDGTGRSSSDWGGGFWVDMLSGWGLDVNFLIDVYMCRDEFSDCSVQNWTGGIVDDSRAIPDGNPALLWAQKFFNTPGGAECELRQLTLHFVRTAGDITAGRDSMYTRNTDIQIKTDNAGYPNGTLLHQVTLTPADYAAAGYTGAAFVGNFYITLDLTVTVPADFWVVVDPQALTRAFGIRHASNLFAGGGGNFDGMATLYGVDSMYYHVQDFFGTAEDGALDITAKVCCVPFGGRACAPPDDNWSSRGHDLARSGASQLPIGDAWCDLNLNWYADETTAALSAQTMGPTIYNGRAYQILEGAAAGSFIRVFDLATGSLVGTIGGAALGNFAENDPICVNNKLYVCGGDNRVISRWDISGAAVPGAPDWTRTLGGAVGPLRRTNLLLVDVSGTLVLFGGSQLGRAFAINESNGLDYPGWATNPIILDAGQLVQGSATDGSQLYFGTRQAGLNGDLRAINPATGGVNWQLSVAGPFLGLTVYASILTEAFTNVSVEAGTLYVGGRPTGNFPTDGLFYRVDAATGAALSVAGVNGALHSYPIIDVNLVYLPTITGWVNPPFDGDLFGFSKTTGAMAWTDENYFEVGADSRYFASGLLTCEPEPDVDILVVGNVRGRLTFVNSLDGTEYFRRWIDYGGGAASGVGGTAIGTDTAGTVHVLVGAALGGLADLTKGIDRPRLEIQDYDPNIAVEFSVSLSEIYTVPNIITNTGCADLTFNAVNVDIASFGATDPFIAPPVVVRPDVLNTASR
ncbi:MAG: PQQ-binding-like beta-propeller repeat protein, partial [Candidatus Zixiibacteriota bacterium]